MPATGLLFSDYFLRSGVEDLPEWRAQTAADHADRLAAARQVVADVVASFDRAAHPNESVTEQLALAPLLDLLGWTARLTQQSLSPTGRSDVPDQLLFADAAARDQALALPQEHRRYARAATFAEAKRWDAPLDRAPGGVAPSTQMLRHAGARLAQGRPGSAQPSFDVTGFTPVTACLTVRSVVPISVRAVLTTGPTHAAPVGDAPPVFAVTCLQSRTGEPSREHKRSGAMVDNRSRASRSALMARIPPRNTAPELSVRRLLHRLGYRFRLHRRDLPGRPDIVLPGRRKAILVHGCFWHGHGCKIGRLPKSNTEFWSVKIEANKSRDRRVCDDLVEAGWETLELWQCETRDIAGLQDRLLAFLGPAGRNRSTSDAVVANPGAT